MANLKQWSKGEELIQAFNRNKTLSNIQAIKNAGLQIKHLTGGEWRPLTTLNFGNYHNAIALYNDDLDLYAVGFYNKL